LKRSGGVTASAIAAFVGSLIFLLLAGSLFVAGSFARWPSELAACMRASYLTGGIILLALFAGGIATGIGLLRLCLWARLSILVFSARWYCYSVFPRRRSYPRRFHRLALGPQ